MAVTLTSNPVTVEDGIVKNLFAGFTNVEFGFKREDLQITSIEAGSDNKVQINVSTDLTDYLEAGDSVYIYGEGSNYTYDDSGEITVITETYMVIDVEYIEPITSGYINWKQNYYLEVELISTINEAASIIPFTLRDDGDNAGNITIDVGIAADYTQRTYAYELAELSDSRIKFKVKYREVYREDTGSYTTISNQVIIYYATEQIDNEQFVQELDEAYIYEGYPFGAIALHSDQNNSGAGYVSFSYDELDINQNDVNTDNSLGVLGASKYGQLFVNLDKDTEYDDSTEYIRFNAELIEEIGFFDPDFFDAAFFETT